MGEIKPGTMCLIIGVVKYTESIGKIVQVTELIISGQGTRRSWLWDGCKGLFGSLEHHLLPINPEADPLEQTQEQEQTA